MFVTHEARSNQARAPRQGISSEGTNNQVQWCLTMSTPAATKSGCHVAASSSATELLKFTLAKGGRCKSARTQGVAARSTAARSAWKKATCGAAGCSEESITRCTEP